jgi:hypothetical protein
MARIRTNRLAALAIAGTAVLGANVGFAATADATVIRVSCPTNGVTISTSGSNHVCFAGNPHGGVLGNVNVSDAWAVGSNWNEGYINYYSYDGRDLSQPFHANGVTYGIGGPSFVYSVTIYG